MTTRHDEPAVAVLDLRGDPGDVGQLEGAVLVLDDAETAAEHDHLYQALLGNPQVSGVLCLAVHGGAVGAPVLVRPAPSLALAERAATLWIGHQHGIRWRPTEAVVRGVQPADPSGLRQLIDALAEPAVFDAVLTSVNTLPYSTASAGMAVERTSLPLSELRRVEDEAIIQFTDKDVWRMPMWMPMHQAPKGSFREVARTIVRISPLEEALVPGSGLALARGHAFESLHGAQHLLVGVDTRSALFGKKRPGRFVGVLAEQLFGAAREFYGKVTVQLRRIDGNLRGERVSGEVVTQLGVRPPAPVLVRDVRDAVRHLVGEWLGRYRSVARLLTELEAERIALEPQGVGRALEELKPLAPPDGPAPKFDTWPPPRFATALAALTGVLAAVGVMPVALVPLLAVLWFAAGLLLHARQPTTTGELGFWAALAPAAWFWGLPALTGGGLTSVAGEPVAQAPWSFVLTVLAVLTYAGTAVASWRRAVRRWRRALDLDNLQAKLARTDGLLGEVLRGEWRPSSQRALLAEGLRYAAIGLTAVRDALAERPALFAPEAEHHDGGSANGWADDQYPPPDRDVYQEVCEVVVADLVDLTVAALRPCWAGIDARRPAEPAAYQQEVRRLLRVYREHVARNGLLAPPPFARNSAHRTSLAARLWAGSAVAGALSCAVTDEMTQLCHATQIDGCSARADGATLVRFAPAAVRELLHDPATAGGAVTWTGNTEIAGTLRLVPLRPGVVQ